MLFFALAVLLGVALICTICARCSRYLLNAATPCPVDKLYPNIWAIFGAFGSVSMRLAKTLSELRLEVLAEDEIPKNGLSKPVGIPGKEGPITGEIGTTSGVSVSGVCETYEN